VKNRQVNQQRHCGERDGNGDLFWGPISCGHGKSKLHRWYFRWTKFAKLPCKVQR
jgi:hypothetical protein